MSHLILHSEFAHLKQAKLKSVGQNEKVYVKIKLYLNHCRDKGYSKCGCGQRKLYPAGDQQEENS